jgi:hypothetical protein
MPPTSTVDSSDGAPMIVRFAIGLAREAADPSICHAVVGPSVADQASMLVSARQPARGSPS